MNRVRSRLLASLIIGLAACRELTWDFELLEPGRRGLCREAARFCSEPIPPTSLADEGSLHPAA